MNDVGTPVMDDSALQDRIRKILKQHARLSRDAERLSEHEDLYAAGMSSHASVNVMLALESEFDLEFPDQMLNRSVFDSIGAIASAIEQLGAA
jgi:acyl carrier protein